MRKVLVPPQVEIGGDAIKPWKSFDGNPDNQVGTYAGFGGGTLYLPQSFLRTSTAQKERSRAGPGLVVVPLPNPDFVQGPGRQASAILQPTLGVTQPPPLPAQAQSLPPQPQGVEAKELAEGTAQAQSSQTQPAATRQAQSPPLSPTLAAPAPVRVQAELEAKDPKQRAQVGQFQGIEQAGIFGQPSLQASNDNLLTAFDLALDYSSVASADQLAIVPSNTSLTTAYLSDNAYNNLKYTTTLATGPPMLTSSDLQLIGATGENQSVPSEISGFHRGYINTLLGRNYLEARKKIVHVDDIIRLPSLRLADTVREVAKLFNYHIGDKKIAMAATLGYDFTSRLMMQPIPTDGPRLNNSQNTSRIHPELGARLGSVQPKNNGEGIEDNFRPGAVEQMRDPVQNTPSWRTGLYVRTGPGINDPRLDQEGKPAPKEIQSKPPIQRYNELTKNASLYVDY